MPRSKDQTGLGAELWGGEGFSAEKWEGKMTFWRLQVAGWGGLGALIMATRSAGLMPDLLPISGIFFYLVLGFLVTSAFRPICRRIFYWHKPLSRMAYILPCLVAGMVLVYEALAVASCSIFYGDAFFYSRFLRGAGVFNHLLILGAWLTLYFLLKQKQFTRELEQENRDSALKLLRYQVNPHFLFNALNSIAAHATDPEKVTLGIEALADYLRFSLNQNRLTHPLGEELAAMENYLTVEKIRFEEKLDYTIEADEAARRHAAPPAVVQPLVENAIKYGTPTAAGVLEMRLTAKVSARELCIAVENSGPWVSTSRRTSPGTGLSNLRNRLGVIYGDRATLAVEKSETHVRVLLKVPANAND